MADRLARLALLGLELFLGVTAVAGAVAVVPTLPRAWLAGSPFPDYTLPALALAAIGGGALAAAALLLLGHDLGVPAALAVGLAIASFEVVETAVVGLDIWLRVLGLTPDLGPVGAAIVAIDDVPAPFGVPAPLWLQPFYVAVGVAIVALALRLGARRVRGGRRAHSVGRRQASRAHDAGG